MSPVPGNADRLAVESLIAKIQTIVDWIPFSECEEDAVTPMQKALQDAKEKLDALISRLENGYTEYTGSQG